MARRKVHHPAILIRKHIRALPGLQLAMLMSDNPPLQQADPPGLLRRCCCASKQAAAERCKHQAHPGHAACIQGSE